MHNLTFSINESEHATIHAAKWPYIYTYDKITVGNEPETTIEKFLGGRDYARQFSNNLYNSPLGLIPPILDKLGLANFTFEHSARTVSEAWYSKDVVYCRDYLQCNFQQWTEFCQTHNWKNAIDGNKSYEGSRRD